MTKEQALQYLHKRAQKSLDFYATDERASLMNTLKPRLMGFIVMLLTFLNTITAAQAGIGDELDKQSEGVFCGFSKFFNGYGGWFFIGVGFLIIIFDLFIQKQTHLLVYGVIGVVAVIIIGKLLCFKLDGDSDCGC